MGKIKKMDRKCWSVGVSHLWWLFRKRHINWRTEKGEGVNPGGGCGGAVQTGASWQQCVFRPAGWGWMNHEEISKSCSQRDSRRGRERRALCIWRTLRTFFFKSNVEPMAGFGAKKLTWFDLLFIGFVGHLCLEWTRFIAFSHSTVFPTSFPCVTELSRIRQFFWILRGLKVWTESSWEEELSSLLILQFSVSSIVPTIGDTNISLTWAERMTRHFCSFRSLDAQEDGLFLLFSLIFKMPLKHLVILKLSHSLFSVY